MVLAATTNMSDGFQLPKGPLGWLIAAGLGGGANLNDAIIHLQCQRNPQDYSYTGATPSNHSCPASNAYFQNVWQHYDYGKTPAQQGLHEVTIGGVKQLVK